MALSFVSYASAALVGSLTLGFFAGKWVDEHLAIYPAGRIAGLFFSVPVAVWAIYVQLKVNFLRSDKDSNP